MYSAELMKDDGLHSARKTILTAVKETLPALDDRETTLLQCLAHVRACRMLTEYAAEAGWELGELTTNEALEIYCDVLREGRTLGDISKGWTDPGFSLGSMLRVPLGQTDRFARIAGDFTNFCMTNGICTQCRTIDDGMMIELRNTIYAEGFNLPVMTKTLDTMAECRDKLEELMGWDEPYPISEDSF